MQYQISGNPTLPKVSVTVVTYNHGDWLAECLESIVSQKTNFPFEVIVGDDASTDGRTTEVLREYAEKYPHMVIPVIRQQNIGPTANYFDLVRRARGAYIAHVDGDDQMLPGKLQIQSDFLDANLDCVMVGHQMKVIDKQGKYLKNFSSNHPKLFDCNYLLSHHAVFAHSSIMYRAYVRDQFHYENIERLDAYIYLLIGTRGRIAFLDLPLGIYRRGVGVASRGWSVPLQEDVISHAEKIGLRTTVIKRYRAYLKLAEAYAAYKEGKYYEYFSATTASIKIRLYSLKQIFLLFHSLVKLLTNLK